MMWIFSIMWMMEYFYLPISRLPYHLPSSSNGVKLKMLGETTLILSHTYDLTFYLIHTAKFCSPVGSFQLANAEPFSTPNYLILSLSHLKLTPWKRGAPSKSKPGPPHHNPLHTHTKHIWDAPQAAIPYPYRPMADDILGLGACSVFTTVVYLENKGIVFSSCLVSIVWLTRAIPLF